MFRALSCTLRGDPFARDFGLNFVALTGQCMSGAKWLALVNLLLVFFLFKAEV